MATTLYNVIGHYWQLRDLQMKATSLARSRARAGRIPASDRKALGLDIPPGVLAIVDAVIE